MGLTLSLKVTSAEGADLAHPPEEAFGYAAVAVGPSVPG